ncbi:MAG: hypothetical protein US63_C0044G0004 [Candidatus Moranbacteria bacterium GW2011_GWC2_37_8]|nr:MAG: hypothetical protein US63_C0044G0004 [Candidatus Moranbacteria bacterium GW2011_GWC2_37_8]KKQ60271.1 MAG: hypothetical protein US82_C0041G0003 [Parcubacteria group bacterium GW2011_GWC1_38_22]KKQ79860.1 MAG: hypothetical protein UT03_C0039G0002 [Candidatus Moranbacteria bacterium GW2011_GWD2_38_7]
MPRFCVYYRHISTIARIIIAPIIAMSMLRGPKIRSGFIIVTITETIQTKTNINIIQSPIFILIDMN